jgi:hypothetical protein
VARKELQAYELEVHAKVQYPHCSKEFEKAALALHQCPRIPKQCDLCELTVPGDLLAAHRDECGNRTEQCVKCKKFIPKKSKLHTDFLAHGLSSCVSDAPSREIRPEHRVPETLSRDKEGRSRPVVPESRPKPSKDSERSDQREVQKNHREVHRGRRRFIETQGNSIEIKRRFKETRGSFIETRRRSIESQKRSIERSDLSTQDLSRSLILLLL